ncbi:ATP-dependent RNA helicase dbp10 [Coelomomyces lativittatus]|nr:ATP-dependent RNA helicase dbp10 [Coelomomyces lativittatus]
MPYLLDLELFLSRPLFYPSLDAEYTLQPTDYMDQLVTGGIPLVLFETEMEWYTLQLKNDVTLATLKRTSENGYKQYLKSRSHASPESHQRYKLLSLSKPFGQTLHPLFKSKVSSLDHQRQHFLFQMTQFRPTETIFEVGQRRCNKSLTTFMQQRRQLTASTVSKFNEKKNQSVSTFDRLNTRHPSAPLDPNLVQTFSQSNSSSSSSSSTKATTRTTTSTPTTSTPSSFQDPQFYLNYLPKDYHTEKGYQTNTTTSLTQAHSLGVTMNLLGDDHPGFLKHQASLKSVVPGTRVWDAKKKKFKRATRGSDNLKLIKGESGVRLPATYQSKRFENWQKKMKKRLPRIGTLEKHEAAV